MTPAVYMLAGGMWWLAATQTKAGIWTLVPLTATFACICGWLMML